MRPLVHFFPPGRKQHDVRCLCGQATWGSIQAWWRTPEGIKAFQAKDEIRRCDQP